MDNYFDMYSDEKYYDEDDTIFFQAEYKDRLRVKDEYSAYFNALFNEIDLQDKELKESYKKKIEEIPYYTLKNIKVLGAVILMDIKMRQDRKDNRELTLIKYIKDVAKERNIDMKNSADILRYYNLIKE